MQGGSFLQLDKQYMRSMQVWTEPHFAHCSEQTMSTVQLTHFSQLVVRSHGDGSPDELLDADD